MPGPDLCPRPRGVRRGAALALVFASVLVTAAATNCLPRAEERPAPLAAGRAVAGLDPREGHTTRGGDRTAEDVARAAAEAQADGKSATRAAEEAVGRSGDRWGAVYDKAQYEQYADALDGRYTGVGLWVSRTADGRTEVTRVQDGGPAARAGIEAGDLLRSVDHWSADGQPVTETVARLRGDAAGSKVVLVLERGSRTWTRTLDRAVLDTEPVAVESLSAKVVMIKVAAFTRGSGERVRAAVHRAPKGAGILLDLRGNSGGLVGEAVTAASAFLDGGLVATYDVHGKQRALYAADDGDDARPLVVLIDGGTMSAAELLTGALQDRGRAVTVGSRTFGKGSVQLPTGLPGGSVAELTVGHYRTPSGRGLDGRGITPDLPVTDRPLEHAETVLSGLGGTS
ncbi:S41 family peptidase [Streptomyces sp. NPDC001691]|uniref:S41 family peptidase n=1 Tax=unclassified Streptomyces TaxID=2593676 RepID=UPI000DE95672|nr:S41 family peptidase [Streptomyces sp. SDr-06]RCH68328.1 PDZ domain-containing protein [Streptomyces sp. SDr-06]